MQERLIHEHGVVEERISVVEYGPERSMVIAYDRQTAREQFGFKEEYIAALIGRLEFSQKCQDFLIRTVANFRDVFNGYRFLIVGDGPDLQAAIDLVTELNIGELIEFMAWQDDMSILYPALDAVLIPSRYEGVPLVMLEAMACRIPVLASAVDGMVDVLPDENLFAYGNAGEMVEKLCGLRNKDNQETLDQLAHVIETRLNATVFADQFTQEILRIAGK
jgi:glycosyltransferase involved in cell wall biosynthesis